jgi:hypothetical protein
MRWNPFGRTAPPYLNLPADRCRPTADIAPPVQLWASERATHPERKLTPLLTPLPARPSVYSGPNLHNALAKLGKWTIEIVKRAADAAGFSCCHAARLSSERSLGPIATAAWQRIFEASNRERQSVGLYRLGTTYDQRLTYTFNL